MGLCPRGLSCECDDMTMMMVHVSTRAPCSSSSQRGDGVLKRGEGLLRKLPPFLDKYDLILNQSPLLGKSLTSFGGFGIADIVAQGLTW